LWFHSLKWVLGKFQRELWWRSAGLSSSRRSKAPISTVTLADLLLLQPAERAVRLARFIDRGDPVPDSLLDEIVPPGENRSNSYLRGRIIAALAAARPNDALLAAVRLPAATADPLVRRILVIFPDSQAAAAAIDAIPDPAAAQRARAWLACLPLGKQGGRKTDDPR
jgi:hypothetical protein